tara:strand:+ start:2591 stop:3007 length:417 start_codon:yes stop_codon:yes gene_type:complete
MPKKELDLRPLINDFKTQRKALPAKLGNIAVKFFQDNFRSEGFVDNSLTRWQRRKRETRRSRGKKILQNTGRLRRSIKRLTTTFGRIVIGTRGVPYAEVHNEGLGNMPKREFVGDSAKLEKLLQQRISKEIAIFAKRL